MNVEYFMNSYSTYHLEEVLHPERHAHASRTQILETNGVETFLMSE